LSPGQEFNGLQVWEFNPSLQGLHCFDIFSPLKNMVGPILVFY
jgi:hypothetical protein